MLFRCHRPKVRWPWIHDNKVAVNRFNIWTLVILYALAIVKAASSQQKPVSTWLLDWRRQTAERGSQCRYVQDLPDLEFVVNINDQPRVIPGHAEDRDVRLAGRLCQNASASFRKHRHLHGYINNR